MSLDITSRIVLGVVVIDMHGRLCLLEVALRAHIDELLDEGHRDFVLNLADVPYIDSFGLGQLVSIWTRLQARGGQFILLRPTDRIRKLFQITRLNSVFRTEGEETQAIRTARRSSSGNRSTAVTISQSALEIV